MGTEGGSVAHPEPKIEHDGVPRLRVKDRGGHFVHAQAALGAFPLPVIHIRERDFVNGRAERWSFSMVATWALTLQVLAFGAWYIRDGVVMASARTWSYYSS